MARIRTKDFLKFKTNAFYHFASLYVEKATTDDEIRNIDMTEVFWREIEQEIVNDEIIIININAKTRMGKSTLGISISQDIIKLLKKHKKCKSDLKFTMRNLARDQQEYSKMMRSSKVRNTVIMTDEMNALEDTGENVTVERALNTVFSDVQAGRYVHRVSCSPRSELDPNTDIFLEVISANRKNKTTHCHLYYRLYKGGQEFKVFIGYVNFDVSKLIKNWESNVKNIFLKDNKTKSEETFIKKEARKDFFVEYMIKKYEKMKLITEEGIFKPRILEYAKIIIEIEEELRPLSKMNVLTKETVTNYVKMKCSKERVVQSIVGTELMTREIMGILSLWKSHEKILSSIQRVVNRRSANKMSLEEFNEKKEQLEEMKKVILKTIHAQIEELRRYSDIYKKYNQHF